MWNCTGRDRQVQCIKDWILLYKSLGGAVVDSGSDVGVLTEVQTRYKVQ